MEHLEHVKCVSVSRMLAIHTKTDFKCHHFGRSRRCSCGYDAYVQSGVAIFHVLLGYREIVHDHVNMWWCSRANVCFIVSHKMAECAHINRWTPLMVFLGPPWIPRAAFRCLTCYRSDSLCATKPRTFLASHSTWCAMSVSRFLSFVERRILCMRMEFGFWGIHTCLCDIGLLHVK